MPKKVNVDGIAAPGGHKKVISPSVSTVVIPAKDGIQKEKAEASTPEAPKVNFFKRHKRPLLISLGVFLIVASISGLVIGGAYAYDQYYTGKTFPGVMVWGENVGGKNVTEMQEVITAKTKAYSLTIKGPDQDYTATTEDLGVMFDTETMMGAALASGRTGNIFADNGTRARLALGLIPWRPWQDLIHAQDLAVQSIFNMDQVRFDAYVAKLADNINITAQDSQVTTVSGQMQLKPAIYGRAVQMDALKGQIQGSVNKFVSEQIAVPTTTVKPAIIDTAAQEVMVQAQSVMKRPVILTYNGTEYRPNQETVASWIAFTKKTGDASYTLVVDPAKMKGYFDFLGSKINIASVSRKVRVENDVNETEVSPGKDGLNVDTAALGQSIAAKLPVQESVTTAIPTYVVKYKTDYDRVIIANWAKYIDVNLTTQTMMACEKGGVNCKSWLVMTGKNSTPTPVGTTLVLGRRKDFWMTGLEGTPGAYRLWVQYATWFKAGGYAIHSASWRNNNPASANGFGNAAYTWNGSHGCVNSPDDAAQYIYYWADTGTPVTVHY